MNDDFLEELEDMGAEVDDTLERLMNDEDMYVEYLLKLPENENINLLKQAVENKDYEQAAKEVHTLKGVALNLGLLPLVDECMDMLLAFRAGNNEEAVSYMPNVDEEFQRWVKVIKDYQN